MSDSALHAWLVMAMTANLTVKFSNDTDDPHRIRVYNSAGEMLAERNMMTQSSTSTCLMTTLAEALAKMVAS